MGPLYLSLPERIQEHLKTLVPESGIAGTDEYLDALAENWNTKRELFEAQIKSLDMVDVESFDSSDPRGALMLTYSGSLVSVSTLQESLRRVEYYSIKLRGDVPGAMKIEATQIVNRAAVDHALELSQGPLQKTSALFKIALFKEEVPLAEQDIRVNEAIIFLTNGFVKINRSLAPDDSSGAGQFSMKSIITQIAQRNDIPQKLARSVLDDYWAILESGILLGEKISLGKIGKVYLKVRSPQKARIGKNFSTGGELTIRAKPEMAVPKISFSSSIKEKARGIFIEPEINK